MLVIELGLGALVLWAVCFVAFKGAVRLLETIERAFDERSRW